MDKFLKEYHGACLEDGITQNSSDVESFSRKFQNYLKRILPDCNVVGYTLGHYHVYSFLERDGKYVYLSYNIPRQCRPIDIHRGEYGFDPMCEDVLIRTAKCERDYHGGPNNYCSLATIADAANMLFAKCWAA